LPRRLLLFFSPLTFYYSLWLAQPIIIITRSLACPPPPPPAPTATCPRDALKLGVCVKLLDDLLHLVVGTPPKKPCCPLIEGLVELEAAVCLCTALIKANVLGINLNVSISLSLLLNYCGKGIPAGFQCA
ncbi:hypothetical protein MANES_01G268801v8, partial [Manihot esculenta]